MNRFDRITAILIQLQSRKIVKAQDIADRFNISLRTVYRDIRSLEEAGIPLIGEAGVGYSIMEGYRLPPVMFTKEEAISFITAEKLMDKFTDFSTKSTYQSAMYKVKAVLRSAEKEAIENIEDNIAVIQRFSRFSASVSDSLSLLLKSIADRKILSMHYTAVNAEGSTLREIEPIGVFHENGYWYIVAFCHLRDSYRNFRIDRIQGISLTDQAFKKEHGTLKEHLNDRPEHIGTEQVIVRVDKKAAAYMGEQKYFYGFVSQSESDDAVEMTFLTPYLPSFARWYLMYADRAEIIEPAHLKEYVRKMIATIAANL
jgi:predicted DNA-binding transcriptional regulator YafY